MIIKFDWENLYVRPYYLSHETLINMEILKELSQIINRNKVKSIEMLNPDTSSKVNTFYKALTEGELESDEQAAAFLYPDLQPDSSNYRKLKASLKRKMTNTLFFIDTKRNNYTDRQAAYYECYKNWAAANILLGKSAYRSCVDLCGKILKYAKKYEFNELCRDIYKLLRLHYSAQLGDVRQYRKFRSAYEKYNNICYWENKAELYYSELMVEYVNNKAMKKFLGQAAEKYLEELRPMASEIATYRFQLYARLIQLLTSSARNDFQEILVHSQSMEAFFRSKKYDAFTPIQISCYYQLMACTQLRKFSEGEKVAQRCIDLMDEGSFNWFKYHELYFTLAMHSGAYDTAYHLYRTVNEHPRFSYMPSSLLEVWKIFGAYLSYLADLGRVELPAEDKLNKFRLGRFLNSTPIFSKDKRGMNIAILTIQILFLVSQEQYDKAIDKLEAIDKYCSRYLFQDETIRSYYFIRMMMCMVQGNFHKVAVERKVAPYLRKLQAVPLEEANQTYKIEVIPYEQLWELAFSSLNMKIHQSRKVLSR